MPFSTDDIRTTRTALSMAITSKNRHTFCSALIVKPRNSSRRSSKAPSRRPFKNRRPILPYRRHSSAFCPIGVGRRIKPSDFTRSDGIRDAMKDQEKIGWTNFFLGRWSPKWQAIQAKHYERISSKKSPRRWATAVIHRLFLVAWDLWQHRNDQLHGKVGTKTLARHLSYDTRIIYK